MDACLESLRDAPLPRLRGHRRQRRLDGPHAARSPSATTAFRVINQENKGLSVARNVGMAAATGEIVAYTDSDCVVDPDWLTLLVYNVPRPRRLRRRRRPELPAARGQRSSRRASRCRRAGRRTCCSTTRSPSTSPAATWRSRSEALEEVGGFEPIFRAAGDDVDLCWRLQNHGHAIGFSPAAIVWHFRRNTVKAYLKQQSGYGKAEALLYFKHPYRFNMLGQSRWLGRIYGDLTASLLSRRARSSTSAPSGAGSSRRSTSRRRRCSRTCRSRSSGTWSAPGLLVAVPSRRRPRLARGSAARADVGGVPGRGAARADRPALRRRARARAHRGSSPISVRSCAAWSATAGAARGLTSSGAGRRRLGAAARPVSWRERAFSVSFWSGARPREGGAARRPPGGARGAQVLRRGRPGWSAWDLEIHRGIWARGRVTVAAENHGGEQRVLRVKTALRAALVTRVRPRGRRSSPPSSARSFGQPALVAVGATGVVLAAGAFAREALSLGRMLYDALEIVGRRVGLARCAAAGATGRRSDA